MLGILSLGASVSAGSIDTTSAPFATPFLDPVDASLLAPVPTEPPRREIAPLAPEPPGGARHLLIPSDRQWPMWKQVSLLYAGQWAYYLATQAEALQQEGSFRNWYSNPASPHFDKDFYDYNLIRHTLAGSLYYGYYRTFGATRQRSLALSTVSVLLFEFTIEVATEPPSWQDIYQTPVLGALLGMGLEDLSLACLRSPSKPIRVVGYLLNPFVLVPGGAWRLEPDPAASLRDGMGGRVVARF